MRPLLRFAAKSAVVTAAACAASSVIGSLRRRRSARAVLARLGGPDTQRASSGDDRPAAFSEEVADETADSGPNPLRPAGRRAMRDPHRRWGQVDEASDESFPASDPPVRY